jgi:hypothetical protein
MITLTHVLAVLTAAGPSASPVEGCTAKPADIGWSYACQGLYAAAKDDPEASPDLRAFLESLERSFQERDGNEPLRQGWERRRLGGREIDVLLADYPGQHDALAGVRLTEGTRVAFCRAREQERCLAVLDALMAAAWRAGPLPGAKVEEREGDAPAAARSTLGALLEKARRHQPIARGELAAASPLELRVVRNAVFAARGQSFKSAELEAFFSAFPWYTPKVAVVPASALDPADRANVELLRAAEAERPGGGAAPQWDLLLLLLQLDGHAGRRPSAEAASLVGTWTEYVSVPDEELLLVRPHYDFFPGGFVTRRWEDCRGGRLVVVGAWEPRGPEIAVRWFAEVRTAGGRSVSRGPDRCPEWQEGPASKLLPVHEQATIAVSEARKGEGGRPERSFDGKVMVKDEDLPKPERFEVEAMRP